MGLRLPGRTRSAPSTFNGIQVLRGIAACMVVCHHATQLWADSVIGHPPYWPTGAAGVDIFFVISGFVMAVSSLGKGSGPLAAWEFLKRRLIRIVPLYWIFTSLILFKILLVQLHPHLGHGHDHPLTPFPYILSSYFFIPYRNSLGSTFPLLGVGWTLSFEMFFYLWFTLALALRVSVVRLLTPALVIVAAIGLLYKDSWPAITSLSDPLLLEFLAGLWLGWAIQRGFQISTQLSLLSGIAGIAGFLFFPEPSRLMRPLLWGLPAFLLILSAVMLEKRFGRSLHSFLLLLGDASYSLYLSHVLTFVACYQILVRLHILPSETASWHGEILTVLICFTISVPVSLLVYRFVENPLNQRLRKRFAPTRREQQRVAEPSNA